MNDNTLFYDQRDPIIATVGTNGNHSISDYADGFFEGAEFIIDECLTRLDNRKLFLENSNLRKNITEDIIVYPICFNIRHSIELYLKEIITYVFDIYKIKNINHQNISSLEHHDINKLWKILQDIHFGKWSINSNIKRECIFDEKFDEYIDSLDKYVTEWGTIDPTGQTFRYPFSNMSIRHLESQSCISILSLFIKSKKYHTKLKEFRDFMHNIKKQYKLGKFTRYFTYHQLISIANELPSYHTWKDIAIDGIILTLSNKYKATSIRKIKEEAINNKIKKDYLLSSMIEIDIPLKALSFEKLTELYLYFNRLCSLDKLNISLVPIPKIKLDDYLEDKLKISNTLQSYTFEELIDFMTICYIGRDNNDLYEYDPIFSYLKSDFSYEKLINKIQEKSGNICFYIEKAMDIFGKKLCKN